MESIIIWSVTILISLLIVIPSVLKFIKKNKEDIERLQDSQRLGLRKPLGLFPFIDLNRCIGCGSCVEACPEGDVLGIVFGKAAIINGMRCVGHGYCAEACPVMGIELGMGNIKEREDIPIIDEHFETTVPGLYLAGEITGIALIRNAIHQGAHTVAHIVNHIDRENDAKDIYDVIIIGFGPAGLSAALTAIQHRLNYLVLDRQEPGGTILQYPRKKLVMTEKIEIPLLTSLKKGEYLKEDLLGLWEQAIRDFAINLNKNEKVLSIRPDADLFQIQTDSNTYVSKKVILAIGRRGIPRKLNVKGEEQQNVAYKLTDATSYNAVVSLVVGGGDSAVEAAIGLSRQKGNTVYISYRKDKFYRIKKKNAERIDELIRKKKITPFFNSTVKEIKSRQVFIEINDRIITLETDYNFILVGGDPPYEFMKLAGIEFHGAKITQTEFRA